MRALRLAVAFAVLSLERALGALLPGVTVSAAPVHPVDQHGVVKAQPLSLPDHVIMLMVWFGFNSLLFEGPF